MSKTVYFAVSCDGKGQQALKTIQDALNGVSCVTRVFLEENTAPALLTRFEKLSKQERDKVAAYMSQRIVAQARRDQMIARAQGQQAVRRPQRLQATGKPTAKPRGTGTVPRASGPAVTQPPRPDHRAEKMAEAKKAIKIANKALVALKEDQANKQYLRDGRFESGDPELPEHIRSVFAQHRAALEARKASKKNPSTTVVHNSHQPPVKVPQHRARGPTVLVLALMPLPGRGTGLKLGPPPCSGRQQNPSRGLLVRLRPDCWALRDIQLLDAPVVLGPTRKTGTMRCRVSTRRRLEFYSSISRRSV